MKIATWNVNSLNVRLPQVIEWLNANPIDILAIQETKMSDDVFPAADIYKAGYNVSFSGQKTYNGVAILTKHDAEDTLTDLPDYNDPQRRILAATINNVRVINLYVPNGQSIDSDKYQYKLDWLKQITAFIDEESKQHKNVVVLGDFNIAPEDRDVHDPAVWENGVLVSEPERTALQKILKLGFKDCFRLSEQEPASFSWWDYRAGSFWRNNGLRIDLILASDALSAKCSHCHIDKEPRKWQRPSDHTPVVAEFDI